jgi:hypothetical protein
VVCAAALACACDVKVGDKGLSFDISEGRASDEWTRTYELPQGGRLEVVNADGTIEVFPATGPRVDVRVSRQVRGRSDDAAQQLLKKLTMHEEVAADRVKIEAPDVRQLGGFGQRVTIDYRISLPPGLNVSLRTQNGSVRLENVDGQFAASSTNGGITGRGVSGAIDASTVNGGVTMELASLTGDARVVTVNGGIRLEIRADVNATLEASTVNGGVIVDERLSFTPTERARVRVSGRINNGGPRLEVRTTNGGIRVGASAAR